MAFGNQVHKLLETLPGLDRADWPDYAARLLAIGENATDDTAAALSEATRILDAPHLSHLFGDHVLSEVDLSANLPELNGDRIAGAIDKLIVTEKTVLAVDFKTNAIVPQSPETVPEGLLRQMGAYHSALAAIYPDHDVQTAILWTRTADLMPLPHEIVRDALRRAATS